jgi:hypothetical protein
MEHNTSMPFPECPLNVGRINCRHTPRSISAIYVHWYLTLNVSSSKDDYTLFQAGNFVQRVLAALSGQRDPDRFPGLHAAAYFGVSLG